MCLIKCRPPLLLLGLEKIRHDHGIREFVAMVTFGHETKIACPSTEDFQQILSYLGKYVSITGTLDTLIF